MQPGDIVIKIIEGAGFRTATLRRVQLVRDGVVYLGDAGEPDDTEAFRESTGRAVENYIAGFHSYLATLDGGEETKVRTEMVT